MKNDLRFALRMIATHRWYSAVIALTVALGIGANTTVFTLVNAVLFKPVPVPRGERLVVVNGQNVTKPDSRFGVSYPDFLELQQHNRTFEGLEGVARDQAVISETGNPPERFSMARVTPTLFTLLQTPTVAGRGITVADGKPGAEPVALISSTVWRNRYGGAQDALGRAVRINGNTATIVGVMPEGFKFPNNEDVWMPFVPTPAELENRSSRPLQIFGIVKPGISIENASADLAAIAQRLATSFPDKNKDVSTLTRTFHDAFNGGPIRIVFLTMFASVGFVLLIACANVAVLMLSRAVSRHREIAVRAAVGASRWQIVRQLLVESVLLSVLGGLLGLGLAAGGVHAFDLATRDVGKPYWILFEMDYVVFGYFAVVSVVSGLLFGLAPALRASRVDLNTALKDGAPAGGSVGGGKLVAALVVLQFALTVVLLAGAGLMVRSFFAAQMVNDFVPVSQLITARVDLPQNKGHRYADRAARLNFYDELLRRLAALPGAPRVALTSNLPTLGSGIREVELEGKPLEKPDTGLRVATGVHTPGYLSLIGLPLIAGREFSETDGEPGKEAAIVTREFAAKYWPNQSALGARFRFMRGTSEKTWITVVGISGDIVQRGQETDAPPLVFTPLRQEPNVGTTILLRAAGDPTTFAPSLRATLQSIDQDLPLFDVRTMAGALERQRWPLKIFGTLFASFAAIALLMASLGLYAVVAQATGRRTREIGIRMALGATAGRILRLVLSRGLTQLGIGLGLGLVGAYFGTQVLAKAGRLLFRTSPHDPTVFTAVALLLLAIGTFACWLPARRAAALHPVKALRHE
jgi:putative ABC transport system permease protein